MTKHKLRASVLVLLLSLWAAGIANAKALPPLTFVLAGQSNMVGMGTPVPTQHPTNTVLFLNDAGKWIPAKDPLYPDGGVGPSLSFARLVHQRTGRTVRLIPCAYSGSSLDEWLPGATPPETYPSPSSWVPLYDQCIAKTRALHIDGLLFYQGETDGILNAWATTWAERFTAMVADWRLDTKQPNLSVVFTQLGPSGYAPDEAFVFMDEVRAQQASIAIPGVTMVSASDLSLQTGDKLHLSVASQITLGRRYGTAWLALRRHA